MMGPAVAGPAAATSAVTRSVRGGHHGGINRVVGVSSCTPGDNRRDVEGLLIGDVAGVRKFGRFAPGAAGQALSGQFPGVLLVPSAAD